MTNFAAFRDVMTELDWIHEGEIYHETLPSLDEESFGYYIDVLNLIDVEWSKYEEQAEIVKDYIKQSGKIISKDAWIHKRPKIFNVYFKKKEECFIKKILKQYSKKYQLCIHYDKKGLESWKW